MVRNATHLTVHKSRNHIQHLAATERTTLQYTNRARVHPDQISQLMHTLLHYRVSAFNHPCPRSKPPKARLLTPKRGTETQKGSQQSVLAPNYSQIGRIYAPRALEASDLTDRARTNPPSSTRDRADLAASQNTSRKEIRSEREK